jgi:hypothetical protein
MTTVRTLSALAAVGLIAGLSAACSEGSDDGGTGGAAGSTPATGGSAGDATTGGSGPTGGTSQGGEAGASPTSGTCIYTFDTDQEGWALGEWSDPPALATDPGFVLTHDSAAGDPNPGSLQVEVPFSDANQKVQVQVALTPAIDLTGRVLTARVRVDSGLNTVGDYPGGAKVYIKTGTAFLYADGGWFNIDGMAPAWTTVTFDVANPAWVDTAGTLEPDNTAIIGIELDTNGTAAAAGTYVPATIHIDSICYE